MRILFHIFILSFFLFPALARAGDLNLDGISYDAQNPSESLAIINGELFKAGQEVGGYQIVRVETTRVQLKNVQSGEELMLGMNATFNKPKGTPAKTAPPQQTQKERFNIFDNIQKKAMEGGKTPDAKAAKEVNMWDSIFTSIQSLMPGAGPGGEYQKFMNHLFRGQFDMAKSYTLGGSAAASAVDSKVKKFSICVANYGKRFAAASYKVESQTKKSEKDIELKVLQTVRGDAPGVTSAFGSTGILYKHTALLTKTDKGWKVKSFSYSPATSGGGAGTYWLCVD